MGSTNLLDLPTEVLIHMLTPFTTHALLETALVCTRFHDLVLRILHGRMALAASLKEHKIIFELYHPTQKNIDPYLFCEYLGTPGLNPKDESQGYPLSFEHDGRTGFGRLGGLYSWFRPVPPEEMARLKRPTPNAQPGQELQYHDENSRQLFGPLRVLANEPDSSGVIKEPAALASYPVHLDFDEGFTQLSMVTNLVKIGPRRGLFEHIVNVSDTTTRLKRDWMKNVAASTLNVGTGVESKEEDSLRTLWVDTGRNIGLKVRLTEKHTPRREQPLLYRESEPAVAYHMEYDALLIRTTRLLLAVEEALLQDRNDGSGKALIIGSFPSQVSAESLKDLDSDGTAVWDVTEEGAGSDSGPVTVEDRIRHLARLLLQRDGLVRSETWA